MKEAKASHRRTRPGRLRLVLPSLLVAMALMAVWLGVSSEAAPVSITVPLSETPVSDADLDGEPSTGAWGDALEVQIPLENGEAAPYGTATLYAKHDGSNLYLRLDGRMDVPWSNVADEYFWLGVLVSPTLTSHHGGEEWDGTFFGLWNGAQYAPQPTYPPRAVDTHGSGRPPDADTLQDNLGMMRTEGTTAPYAFTAEWKRPLDSGDDEDIAYAPDGVTTYNFFVSTDSDGGGSASGGISHRQMTNLNVMKFEIAQSLITPPTIVHRPPEDLVTGEDAALTARVVDAEGLADVRVNYTDVTGAPANESMTLDGGFYVFTIPAQNESGTLSYFLWASDTMGNEARTLSYEIPVAKLLAVPSLQEVVPLAAGCLQIAWTGVSDPELTGYRLYRWNTSIKEMVVIATLSADATSYMDCDLEPDRVYAYWLIAFDVEDNMSPPSAMISGRTSAPTEPVLAAPAVLVALAIVAGLTALAALVALMITMVLGRLRPPKGGGEPS